MVELNFLYLLLMKHKGHLYIVWVVLMLMSFSAHSRSCCVDNRSWITIQSNILVQRQEWKYRCVWWIMVVWSFTVQYVVWEVCEFRMREKVRSDHSLGGCGAMYSVREAPLQVSKLASSSVLKEANRVCGTLLLFCHAAWCHIKKTLMLMRLL